MTAEEFKARALTALEKRLAFHQRAVQYALSQTMWERLAAAAIQVEAIQQDIEAIRSLETT